MSDEFEEYVIELPENFDVDELEDGDEIFFVAVEDDDDEDWGDEEE